ncbi:MAG: hypothetical protein LBT70_02905 [Holosporaceae bacterium]|jgi:hypothetical protein|nr:hypothetical protein [Holosporaceae bacterium]
MALILLVSCILCLTESIGMLASSKVYNLFEDAYLADNEKKLAEAQTINVLDGFPIISHFWVADFLSQVHGLMNFIAISLTLDKLPTLENNISQVSQPSGDCHEIEDFNSKKTIDYENFLNITNHHTIRERYDFTKMLSNIDHMLANIRIQELIFKKNKILYTKSQKSFDSIKRNLLLLRHDMELALIFKKNPFEKEREIIRPYSGRVFCVEKKLGKRTIRPVGSGTIVNINGKNYILTCRHFLEFEYSVNSELEIYFIPIDKLSKKDFLPEARLGSNIHWNNYRDYMINAILLINNVGANHKNETDKTPLVDHIVLRAGTINRIEELRNNNDIMLMTANVSNSVPLVKSQLVPYKNISDACIAGYPADGFADYSFIATKISGSQIYLKSLLYNPPPPALIDYVFTGIPVTHGMSGGPVFIIDADSPLIFGVLQGADLAQLSTRCSVVTNELLAQILKHITELS